MNVQSRALLTVALPHSTPMANSGLVRYYWFLGSKNNFKNIQSNLQELSPYWMYIILSVLLINFFLCCTGGSPKMPRGLPPAYYQGFRGCIDSIQVENRDLNLVTHGDSSLVRFCDEMR